MDWIQQWQSKLNKQNGVAPLVRTGGSRHTGLAALPYRNIHLFCGRRSDRIKGLLWMGDGFLQLYKRLEAGSLSWPRTSEEAADLTEEQFRYLMIGLNPLNPKVREVTPQKPT